MKLATSRFVESHFLIIGVARVCGDTKLNRSKGRKVKPEGGNASDCLLMQPNGYCCVGIALLHLHNFKFSLNSGKKMCTN